MSSYTVLITSGPESAIKLAETNPHPPQMQALDFALAAAAFGHDVMLILKGDGLTLLTQGLAESDRFSRTLKQLEVFDLAPLYLCETSLAQSALQVSQLTDIPVMPLSDADLRHAIHPPRHCLIF